MTPSENRPHRVTRKVYPFARAYPPDYSNALGPIFDTYQEAHASWATRHSYRDPFVIVTVATGRVIAPETPIVDVNE